MNIGHLDRTESNLWLSVQFEYSSYDVVFYEQQFLSSGMFGVKIHIQHGTMYSACVTYFKVCSKISNWKSCMAKI